MNIKNWFGKKKSNVETIRGLGDLTRSEEDREKLREIIEARDDVDIIEVPDGPFERAIVDCTQGVIRAVHEDSKHGGRDVVQFAIVAIGAPAQDGEAFCIIQGAGQSEDRQAQRKALRKALEIACEQLREEEVKDAFEGMTPGGGDIPVAH